MADTATETVPFFDLPGTIERVRVNAERVRTSFQEWELSTKKIAHIDGHPTTHFSQRVGQMDRVIEKLKEIEAILAEPTHEK